MLDGKAYRAHFPDDPAYELPPGVPRQLNSAALMEALAALVWTDVPDLMEISEASLDAAVSTVTST